MRFLLALIVICSFGGVARADQMIDIIEPVIRMVPGTDAPAAGFMTLLNNGTGPAILVKVTSPMIDQIEMHDMEIVKSVMKMRKLDNITLTPGRKARFESGGRHLMLFGLKRLSGPTVPITLHFADGQTVTKDFAVTTPQR